MQVIAKDTEGNEFIKTVTTRITTGEHSKAGQLIICFGCPIEYYAEDLFEYYPFQKPMCIDMMGRNHKGYEVTISIEQMNKIIEHFYLN